MSQGSMKTLEKCQHLAKLSFNHYQLKHFGYFDR